MTLRAPFGRMATWPPELSLIYSIREETSFKSETGGTDYKGSGFRMCVELVAFSAMTFLNVVNQ